MKIIQLCGLYGAGKSTLRSRMTMSDINCLRWDYRLPRFRNLHRFFLSALWIIPALIIAGIDADWFKRLKLVLYLEVLAQDLLRYKHAMKEILLWDEGPIALHAFLRVRIGKCRNQFIVDRILDMNIRKIARVLDGMIWLDAPDQILIQRVRSRPQPHMLKNRSWDDACRFYGQYRCVYEQMIITWKNHGVQMLQVMTNQCTPDEVEKRVFEFINTNALP